MKRKQGLGGYRQLRLNLRKTGTVQLFIDLRRFQGLEEITRITTTKIYTRMRKAQRLNSWFVNRDSSIVNRITNPESPNPE